MLLCVLSLSRVSYTMRFTKVHVHTYSNYALPAIVPLPLASIRTPLGLTSGTVIYYPLSTGVSQSFTIPILGLFSIFRVAYISVVFQIAGPVNVSTLVIHPGLSLRFFFLSLRAACWG